jgi:endonuclease YncB( thermonuclease family)
LHRRRLALAAALIAALGLAAARTPGPNQLTGRVVGVSDGDTLTLVTSARTQVKVRLDQIDAPESGQPWGARSKQALSGLVHAKTVRVKVSGQDRYGRSIGTVRAGEVDVNERMVREGAAWAYRDYLKDKRLLTVERDARTARRGLWALPQDQIEAPWDWRAERRAASARTPTTTACAKRTCSVMTSCAEAKTALRQCALPHLDADRDGVPCESLCRPS